MYKTGKKITKFCDNEIEKQKFHQNKRPISIKIWMVIKQHLNGYTKWRCTKYNLLLTSSDISA